MKLAFIPALLKDDDIEQGEEQHVVISVEVIEHQTTGETLIELMFNVDDPKSTAISVAVQPQLLIDLITAALRGEATGTIQ